jgi:hypothetical protein
MGILKGTATLLAAITNVICGRVESLKLTSELLGQ